MRPPFFIGACLIFWGFIVDLPVAGIAAGLILELSFLIRKKRIFTLSDYTTLSDLSTILVIVSLLLMLLTYERSEIVINFFKWYPAALFPVMIGQYFGHEEKVIIATRFGKKKGTVPHMHKPLVITPYYAAICILSAAIVNNRTPLFFLGTSILLIWGLWTFPSRRYRTYTKIIVGVAIIVSAFAVQTAYDYTRQWMWQQFMNYVRDHRFHSSRGDVSHTSIGDIGKIKQDDTIILRVTSRDSAPFYIRRASYSIFRRSSWYIPNIPKEQLNLSDDVWEIIPKNETFPTREMTLQVNIPAGRHRNLPVPRATHTLVNLNVADLSRNDLGSLTFTEGPTFLNFTAYYSPALPFETPPLSEDILVPYSEKAMLERIAQETGLLQATTARHAVELTEKFFLTDFSYSLRQEPVPSGITPMENFLTRTKKGHCEYFATATVLLLRTAGVPARYITGYYVYEYSKVEKKYIARVRHGHAWVSAFVDGKWIDIDTTPGVWFEEENTHTKSFLRPIRDFFSYIRNQYFLLSATKSATLNTYLAVIVAILAALLVYRIYRNARQKRPVSTIYKKYPGIDSLFYEIEKNLLTLGINRPGHLTLKKWLALLQERNLIKKDDTIEHLLRLHYRLRFDPVGLTDAELHDFTELGTQWLSSFRNDDHN